jgi:ABC-type multidrug transport system ATPase subunit
VDTQTKPVIPQVGEADDVIIARDLELKNLIGCPYSGINLAIHKGEVFAIRGHNGSGKTSLLLTLAGRMNFTKGSLRVLGYDLPHGRGKVQKRVSLALFEGVNDLQESLRVTYAVGSELELYGRKPTAEVIEEVLKKVPELYEVRDQRIANLTADQLVMLGVLLAWLSHPDIIVVDDIESQLTKDQSTNIMQRITELAHQDDITLVVGVIERDLAHMADDALYLEKDGE